MNKILADAPAVRLAIPLLLGGYLGWLYPFDIKYLWVVILLLVTLIYIAHKAVSFKYRWVFGLTTSILSLTVGFVLITSSINRALVEPPKCKKAMVLAKKVVEKSEDKTQCDGTFIGIVDSLGKVSDYSGNIRLTIFNEDSIIVPGDTLLVNGVFKKPVNFLPASEYNYVAFLKSKGTSVVSSLDGKNCYIIGRASSTDFWALSRKLNLKISERIANAPINPDAKGILRALLLGDKSLVSNEVRNDIAVSGLLHILTVSGLHTGIVFLVFSYLFKSVRKRKIGLVIYGVVSILALWFYASVTGLAPSVCRAALMFSVMVLGQCMGRKSISLNSVAVAAIILFLFDPVIIVGLSFQLSFSAVSGIIIANPLLSYLRTSSRVLNFLIPIAFVSLIATLATMPLILFHFGQFPSYFMLSNLVVLPFMPLVMYCGFMAIILDWTVIWQFLDILISLFLSFINWVSKLPEALITDIELSGVFAILFAVSVLCFINWLVLFKTRWGIASILFFTIGFGLDTFLHFNNSVSSICVYSSQGDKKVVLENNGVIYKIYPESNSVSVSDQEVMLYDIENKLVAICRNFPVESVALNKIDLLLVDRLYIQPQKIEPLLTGFEGTLVIYEKIKSVDRKKLIALLHRMGINYHVVAENGVFEMIIK